VTVVVWIFALLAAPVHISAFAMETLLFQRPGVHQGVFAIPTADVRPVRLWAVNVGFYNLFFACGLIVGVLAWMTGNETTGRALVIYLCLFTFLAGIVTHGRPIERSRNISTVGSRCGRRRTR
jgi:putative membrane protein